MLEGGVEFAPAGEALVADPSGALYWPREGALIVADLHLEKGSATRGAASSWPPTTRATLAIPERALARLKVRTIIALGDSYDWAR
ncbi:MAG: hypothetical protein U1E87_00380 [Alphaproteobacteria bacterium]